MSLIPSGLGLNLKFFLSGPLPCPYVPDQVERKLFTRLDDTPCANAEVNAALCRAGFRRSQDILYRPACNACNACVPVRIPTDVFSPSRSQSRIEKMNRDLFVECAPAVPSRELFDLFSDYQKARHGDSDMARMTGDDFAEMLEEGHADACLYNLRDAKGTLKACMIADLVIDGVSAVYSFFTPFEARRSLGTALILALVREARKSNRRFVYLGYWIERARKMSYKSKFRPLQILNANGWEWLEEGQKGRTQWSRFRL